MAEKPGSTERYLAELAAGLEALGPEATADVIAEVRAHLAEALADAGGDEASVLARFGASDALAARILEERGVLPTGSGVPEAAAGTRALALAADIALWTAAFAFVLVPLAAIPMFNGAPPTGVVALVWAALAVAVAGTAWWRIVRWRETGNPTMGMRLLGVRRIRLGEATRIIRQRDVPGLPRPRRLWPLVVTVLAVLVLSALFSTTAMNSRNVLEAQIRSALNDASTGMSIVGGLYQKVAGGGTLDDMNGMYEPAAAGAISQLVDRRAAGKVASYDLGQVELGDYETRLGEWPERTNTIVVLVTVYESEDKPETPGVGYRWKVVCELTDEGNGVSGGEWLIRSAEAVVE